MTDLSEKSKDSLSWVLQYINENPGLTSLLYDMNLLPETAMKNRAETMAMIACCCGWKAAKADDGLK